MSFVIVDKLPEGKTVKNYYGGIINSGIIWEKDTRFARKYAFKSDAETQRTKLAKENNGEIYFVEELKDGAESPQ